MKYIKYLLLFIFFFASANVYEILGQDVADNKVIVILENGSRFEANLVEWDQENNVIRLEAFGSIVEFSNDEVKSIVQKNLTKIEPYTFKEEGNYYQLRVNLISGNPGNRSNFQPGIGVSLSAGKRFNRLLSLGAGVSFDEYIVGTSENILSTFGEISGYLNPHNLSLSYSLAAGYGFAFKDEEANLTSAKGGMMVYPALGLRWGKNHLKWTFDVGYKFQDANWVYENWGTISDQNILYRRLTLRTGVMF